MVMPLWDDSPLKLPKLPLVTWGLIAANILVFAFQALAPASSEQALLASLALTPANLTGTPINPTAFPPFLTLITYQFLHADFWHIFGNMIFLWVFGDDVEEAMGSLRFIGFYLASGIAAGLVFTASTPHSQLPLIGASGAIAGVLAAYLSSLSESISIPALVHSVVCRPPGGAARRLLGARRLGADATVVDLGADAGRRRLYGACRRPRGRRGNVSSAALSDRAPVRMHPFGRGEAGAEPDQLGQAMRAAQHER